MRRRESLLAERRVVPAGGRRRRVVAQEPRSEEEAEAARRAAPIAGTGREEREAVGLGAVRAAPQRLAEDLHRDARAHGGIVERRRRVGEVRAVDLVEAHEALAGDRARVEAALVPREGHEERARAGVAALPFEERLLRRGLRDGGGGALVRGAPGGGGLERDHQREDPGGEHETRAGRADLGVCDARRVRRKATFVLRCARRGVARRVNCPMSRRFRRHSSSSSSTRISPSGPRRPMRAMRRWRKRRLTPASSAARVRFPSVRASMART